MQTQILLNDPTTPDLIKTIDMPQPIETLPKFKVEGYNGAANFGSDNWQASQVYYTLATAMNFYSPITPRAFTNWAATNNLHVSPKAGRDFNAYYDRSNLKFFYDIDPITNQQIFACESVEVVSHELGHAILDAMRPDLWNCPIVEAWAFHEAFGDIIAMITTMQHDEILNRMLTETSNTMETSNVVSRLAEQIGKGVYDVVKKAGNPAPDRPSDCLRNAVNDFAYAQPNRLPKNGSDSVLLSEPHSFSRVFVGTFYDIFVGIYKKQLGMGKSPLDSAKEARNAAAYLIAQAITGAPLVPRFFESVAKTMLQIDHNIGSPNADVLKWAFKRRKIMKAQITALSSAHLSDYNLENYNVEKCEHHTILRKCNTTCMRLTDHGIQAQSSNPLFNAEIEAPTQSYMKFDSNGHLMEEIVPKKKDVVDSIKLALNHIKHANLCGEDADHHKPFSLINGKLKRNFIVCCC